jgi:hypothetical protein
MLKETIGQTPVVGSITRSLLIAFRRWTFGSRSDWEMTCREGCIPDPEVTCVISRQTQ